MLVRADGLAETPKAFQDYVFKYFLKEVIFGTICYVAVRVSSVKTYDGCGRVICGVAPCHLVDLMEFEEGLGNSSNLSQWIESALKRKKNPIVFEFCASWNDGCIESIVDDY